MAQKGKGCYYNTKLLQKSPTVEEKPPVPEENSTTERRGDLVWKESIIKEDKEKIK